MTEPELGESQTGKDEEHFSEALPELTPQQHVHSKEIIPGTIEGHNASEGGSTLSDENTGVIMTAHTHQLEMGHTEEKPNSPKRPKKLKLECNGDAPAKRKRSRMRNATVKRTNNNVIPILPLFSHNVNNHHSDPKYKRHSVTD